MTVCWAGAATDVALIGAGNDSLFGIRATAAIVGRPGRHDALEFSGANVSENIDIRPTAGECLLPPMSPTSPWTQRREASLRAFAASTKTSPSATSAHGHHRRGGDLEGALNSGTRDGSRQVKVSGKQGDDEIVVRTAGWRDQVAARRQMSPSSLRSDDRLVVKARRRRRDRPSGLAERQMRLTLNGGLGERPC